MPLSELQKQASDLYKDEAFEQAVSADRSVWYFRGALLEIFDGKDTFSRPEEIVDMVQAAYDKACEPTESTGGIVLATTMQDALQKGGSNNSELSS